MKPSEFPEANSVLTAPEGMPSCMDLPVYRHATIPGALPDRSHLVSLWRPTWRERFSLLFFGRIWLDFAGARTHPPVAVSAVRTYFS